MYWWLVYWCVGVLAVGDLVWIGPGESYPSGPQPAALVYWWSVNWCVGVLAVGVLAVGDLVWLEMTNLKLQRDGACLEVSNSKFNVLFERLALPEFHKHVKK